MFTERRLKLTFLLSCRLAKKVCTGTGKSSMDVPSIRGFLQRSFCTLRICLTDDKTIQDVPVKIPRSIRDLLKIIVQEQDNRKDWQ